MCLKGIKNNNKDYGYACTELGIYHFQGMHGGAVSLFLSSNCNLRCLLVCRLLCLFVSRCFYCSWRLSVQNVGKHVLSFVVYSSMFALVCLSFSVCFVFSSPLTMDQLGNPSTFNNMGHIFRTIETDMQEGQAFLFFFFLDYNPTVFENFVTDVKIDGKPVQLALWDTAGQEAYERLRPLSYTKAHVILIGYSVDTPDSLDNVTSKWIQEVQVHCPETPVILVGMKKDLRDDQAASTGAEAKTTRFVTTAEAERVAAEIGARNHLECSALTGDGVDDVFEAATRGALTQGNQSQESGCCIIL
ncbi:P-loop containing nucleoside triphosphate hydrolase protein [Linnemannia elongata]|nr:P-loop containing nucleoside triphosphate hydrolase protein [Linnemannia elongata]